MPLKNIEIDHDFEAGEAFEKYHRSTGNHRETAALAFGRAVCIQNVRQIRALLYADESFEKYDRRGLIRALITVCTVVTAIRATNRN